jgi:putative transposase
VVDEKRKLIEPKNGQISLTRQCQLLGLSRASWYYQPKTETEENLKLMKLIDAQYTETPFYGVRRMTAWLRTQGYQVNPKRVGRLMKLLGLETIYPRPKLSIGEDNHRKYPYLLSDLSIDAPNQVWCSDITYIRMPHGFVYLVAIMDWYSRFVLSWQLSNTLDVHFCLEALDEAFRWGEPEIFNSDQGSQYTCGDFTSRLLTQGVEISQDGRGRVFDNIFVEGLWRSVKYEEVYLKDYETVAVAQESLSRYFQFYNYQRLHQALGYQPPAVVHFSLLGGEIS